jgi:hypothetical protein
MSRFIRFLFFCSLTGILWSCASPVSPTGGPRDEQPPRLDSTAYSTPNYQTNFEKQTIELTFDEWVQLNNPNTQVLVSPPLEFRPEVRLKKRTVLFEFDEKEQLRDSATYTINFGEAIEDLTERNPAEDLRFVFSTGPYIDSLAVAGLVIDARTNEAVKDVRVMLYDNLADSVVRTERPFYFAKSGEDGRFSIENVRAGLFKLFALEDANLNYRFDQITERIAIIPEPLNISGDSAGQVLMRLFLSKPPLQVTDVAQSRFGYFRLTFNRPPDDLAFEPTNPPDTLIYEYEQDSLKVWYPQAENEAWSLIVRSGETLDDTIQVAAYSKTEWLSTGRLTRRGKTQPGQVETVNPDRSVRIGLNHPITGWDTSRIVLLEDSVRTRVIPTLSLDTARIRDLVVNYRWKEETIYQLQLLPDALEDIFGLPNQDTIVQDYRVSARKNFGILSLKILDMSPDSAYLIEVLQNDQQVVHEQWITGQTEWERKLLSLPTGNYSVRVTLDLNQNKKWDTGDYDANRLPEPILLQGLGNLRANWEVEGEVSLSPDKFNVPVQKEQPGQGRSQG